MKVGDWGKGTVTPHGPLDTGYSASRDAGRNPPGGPDRAFVGRLGPAKPGPWRTETARE
jgi:hypothetical protein